MRLISDPIKLEHYLELNGVLIVDLVGQEMTRPTNFSVPWEALAGTEVRFTWRARWRSS